MDKETAVPSQAELNVYVSSPSGSRAKETTFREWVVNNQIGTHTPPPRPATAASTASEDNSHRPSLVTGISLTILAMLLALHNLYPSLRPYTQPFFELSYYDPATNQYVQGWDDVYFVVSAALVLTAIRAIAIEWIIQPMARHAGLGRKGSIRLAEQGWQVMYYSFVWATGLYLWKNSYYWFDFSAIWDEWPARPLSGLMKWYLLVELAFLIQSIFIIHVEEKRKDHYQMFAHHVITSTLLTSAYIYGFYNVSNVVLCLMDIVDFLLPAAKILKYLKYQNACNVGFGIFMSTWFMTRHVLYNMLWWSIYTNVPDKMAYGCYSSATTKMISTTASADLFGPFRSFDEPICMSPTIKFIFLSFLLSIQVLSIVWFTMIVRVAYTTITTGAAEDSRSDDEDEAEVDTEATPNGTVRLAAKDGVSVPPVAVDTAPGLDRRRSNGSASVRARGRGRVPFDQSDRKALLGRIGCDKPT
ncbi:hypothetical protein N7532_007516 [Penicillium argentinense]|uniref:TLC domain-containing protein n=1 Tax=Penicillium argentinense TaxID=1131581 RepID=A0A9W9F7U3_9EURO|nr:uncharacterized protein N7532_007516 [Penicillium argentinense]KAJ5095225.1 hypothetical protein N7532_007516 [Penicillium argentinense]